MKPYNPILYPNDRLSGHVLLKDGANRYFFFQLFTTKQKRKVKKHLYAICKYLKIHPKDKTKIIF